MAPRDSAGGIPAGSFNQASKADDDAAHLTKVELINKDPYVDDLRDVWEEANPAPKFQGKSGLELAKAIFFYVLPIAEWASNYKLAWLYGDIVAGLTIGTMAIPQDLAYAQIAKLQPINGLYASWLPPLVYSIWGSSRHIAVGPVAVVSLLIGELLPHKANPTKQPAQYLKLALLLNFWVGIIQLAFGIFRLGFLIEFISHAAIVGFMSAAAITIGLSQLKSLCGYSSFTNKTTVQAVASSLKEYHHQFVWRTFVIGVAALIFLLICKYIGKQRKYLWWIKAFSPLFAVIVSELIIKYSKVYTKGVKILKKVPKGIPPWSGNFDWSNNNEVIGYAFIVGFVAITEHVSIAQTFAEKNNYELHGSSEVFAFGLSNIVGSLSSAYTVTGSFSRSAVNESVGANTALSNIIMSFIILFTLIFLTPLFYYLANTILSAIIISALVDLVDIKGFIQLYKVDKVDFLVALATFFGVLFISVEIGIGIAVGLSLLKVILRAVRPHTTRLGLIPGTQIFRSVRQYSDLYSPRGILVVSFNASIFFANVRWIKSRLLRFVDEYNEEHAGDVDFTPLQYLVIDLSSSPSLDTTGAIVLKDVVPLLERKGVKLALAAPSTEVIYRLDKALSLNVIGQENLFVDPVQAVKVLETRVKEEGGVIKEAV